MKLNHLITSTVGYGVLTNFFQGAFFSEGESHEHSRKSCRDFVGGICDRKPGIRAIRPDLKRFAAVREVRTGQDQRAA
jgi:hypothetical protein